MKKLILLLIFFALETHLYGQSLSIFDVDSSSFPIMKAKFYAFDSDGKQVLNLSPSDFEIMENDEQRDILNVSCPDPKPPLDISSVLTIDISVSMGGKNLELALAAAKAWIEAMALEKSECAITVFNTENFFVQDFTNDRSVLLEALETIRSDGGSGNASR